MDLDRLERLLWIGTGLCFLALIVLILGEVRGWWNDAGEIAITSVSIIAALLGVIALLVNATKGQVSAVTMGVVDNGRRLGLIHESVRDLPQAMNTLNDGMGTLNDGMGTLNDGMGTLNDGMGTLNDGMGSLHEGMRTLHEDMTGLKEENQRQTEVLVEIRDRL